jgi:hypothetical protein
MEIPGQFSPEIDTAGSESTQNLPVRTFRSFEAEAQWLIR